MREILLLLFVVFLGIIASALAILKMYQNKGEQSRIEQQHQERLKKLGFMGKLNENQLIGKLGKSLPNDGLEKIFYRSKNPWGLTIETFQFIRFIGAFVLIVAGLSAWNLSEYAGMALVLSGVLCWWYPKYYYTAIGNEREIEWNKLYEFIWVIKHNSSLYGPKRTFLEMKLYLEKHAAQNKEMIQGFSDFYDYWDDDEIPEFITLYYSFSIPRELYQIIFNSNRTGVQGEDSLNALRKFIINAQDLQVNRTLSGVSGKATIFSLPFLMVSVILGLMVPLIMQIVGMM